MCGSSIAPLSLSLLVGHHLLLSLAFLRMLLWARTGDEGFQGGLPRSRISSCPGYTPHINQPETGERERVRTLKKKICEVALSSSASMPPPAPKRRRAEMTTTSGSAAGGGGPAEAVDAAAAAAATEKMMRERVAQAAAKLGEVKVSPRKDGKRFVSKNSLAEAVKGTGRNGQPRKGTVAWHLCLRRDRCQLPAPPNGRRNGRWPDLERL